MIFIQVFQFEEIPRLFWNEPVKFLLLALPGLARARTATAAVGELIVVLVALLDLRPGAVLGCILLGCVPRGCVARAIALALFAPTAVRGRARLRCGRSCPH